MAFFDKGLPTEAPCLASGNPTLASKCQIHLSMIGVSKTIGSLQNNLPHYRNIRTLQLDNIPERRSPSVHGSQDGYSSHCFAFEKCIDGRECPQVSTFIQLDDDIGEFQEPCISYGAAISIAQSLEPRKVTARDYELNKTTLLTDCDKATKVGNLMNPFIFMIDINVLKYGKNTCNSSKFLNLPREIRDLIYRSALVSPSGGRLKLSTKVQDEADKWSAGEEFAPNINLMCTCKQIRTETQQIFYQNNTFIVRNCVSASLSEYFPGSLLVLLKSIELQFTVAHCQSSCQNLSSQEVCTENLFIDKAFHPQFEHDEGLMKCWSTKAQLITRLPSLQDLTINVADPTLHYYSRTTQLWIISVSLAQLRIRQERGFANCRIHVTGLLLQFFDWFLQASQLKDPQEKYYAKGNEIIDLS